MIVDKDLERDLRVMLHRRAADISDVVLAWTPAEAAPLTDRRRPWLVAAASVAVVAGVGVLALQTVDDGSATLRTDITAEETPPGETATTIVTSTDFVGSGLPIFTADGDVETVAAAYLADRTNVPLIVDRVETGKSGAIVIWHGEGASGTIELAFVDGRWAVMSSNTDGIAIDMAYDGTRVFGSVTTPVSEVAAVDVVTLDGEIVPGAPFPGYPEGAADRRGTANQGSRMDIEVPADGQPVLLQVRSVAGGYYSISERRLDPPAGVSDGGVYSAVGSAEAVASSYLRDRLGAVDGIEVGAATVQGMTATIDWSRTLSDGRVVSGAMGVTRDGDRWSVLACEVDGVGIDLSGSTRDTLRITASVDLDAGVRVELLDDRGSRLGSGIWPQEVRAAGAGLVAEFSWRGESSGVVQVAIVDADDVPLAIAEQRVSVS